MTQQYDNESLRLLQFRSELVENRVKVIYDYDVSKTENKFTLKISIKAEALIKAYNRVLLGP